MRLQIQVAVLGLSAPERKLEVDSILVAAKPIVLTAGLSQKIPSAAICCNDSEVFNSILPPFLVKRILRNPSHAIGDRTSAFSRRGWVPDGPSVHHCSPWPRQGVERVSILFVLLTDFERYSMTMTPVKLFRFLNAARSLPGGGGF